MELTHAFIKLGGSCAAKRTHVNRERGPAHCRKVEIRGKNLFIPLFYSLVFFFCISHYFPAPNIKIAAYPDGDNRVQSFVQLWMEIIYSF